MTMNWKLDSSGSGYPERTGPICIGFRTFKLTSCNVVEVSEKLPCLSRRTKLELMEAPNLGSTYSDTTRSPRVSSNQWDIRLRRQSCEESWGATMTNNGWFRIPKYLPGKWDREASNLQWSGNARSWGLCHERWCHSKIV